MFKMTSAFQSARRAPSPTLRRCSTTILPTTMLLLLVYFSAFVLVSAFTTPSATTTTTTTRTTRTTTLFHNDHHVARFHGSSTTSRISIRSFPFSSSHKSAKSDYDATTATATTATVTALPTVISPSDIEHMKHAIKLARIGYGNTFPNPAVGCVLVRHSPTTTNDNNNNNDDDDDDDTGDVVIGSGFHPKAGMPHAEVFALLEACGHVEDGVASARSVMGMDDDNNDNNPNDNERKDIYNLLAAYKSPDGPTSLFQNRLLPSLFQDGSNQKEGEVTAYVTLEPCCHTGRTPPCAVSLLVAGVSRVVIGYSDPNPRVDGGGIALLKQHHQHQQQERGGGKVQVDLMSRLYSTERVVSYEEKEVAKECASLVEYFVKRIASISGEEENGVDGGNGASSSSISGAQKRALRRIAGTKKNEGTMTKIDWPRDKKKSTSTTSSSSSANTTEEEDEDEDDNNNTNNNLEQEEQQQQQLQNQLSVQTHHRFLENLDNSLWDHELVLVRLNAIVKKKKDAKVVGTWLGEVLKAHVAQVVGHTVLLYREGRPKGLDLEELVNGGEQ